MRPSLLCRFPFTLFPVFPAVLSRPRFVCLLTHTFDNFARPLVAYKVLWMYMNCLGSTRKDWMESGRLSQCVLGGEDTGLTTGGSLSHSQGP